MRHETTETTEIAEAALDAGDIFEIEAAELELREDLLGSLSLFSCCCPCYSNGISG